MGAAERYDLVIVGGGPGGYVAAARAAKLGMRVVCVEREERLGGVCLRVGCIPSKALLYSSERYHELRLGLEDHGIGAGEVRLDLARMLARKDEVVAGLTASVRKLLERSGVEIVRGVGSLAGPDAVAVAGDSPRTLSTRHILLATGSEPVNLPALPADGERIVTSTEALAFPSVPEHLCIVGGGYIGLELGSVWARLGAKVTVLEALPRIAATLDGQIGRYLERVLKKQGLTFRVNTRVEQATVDGDTVRVRLAAADGQGTEELTCDRLLVAVGRKPLTRGLKLKENGVAVDEGSGRVRIDAGYRTSVPSIFAVGDLVDGPMLAHKASAEGTAAVEIMAGVPGEVDYDAVPAAVYTAPEVAAVGMTEEQAKERGVAYGVGAFPFGGVGRARCSGETEGMVKILAHSRSGRLLGAHIIGPRASDLIAECVTVLRFGGQARDLARAVHGHPTFGEAVMEAAAAFG